MPNLHETIKLINADLNENSHRRGFRGFLGAVVGTPGVRVTTLYRISQLAYSIENSFCRMVGRLLWMRLVHTSSCHISLNAEIGGGLKVPHPTGIVVGDGVVLGNRVTIFQNVTLGNSAPGENNYPKLGENVVVYAGSVVVGSVVIGPGAIIGALSFVSKNVDGGQTVVGAPAKPVKSSRTKLSETN